MPNLINANNAVKSSATITQSQWSEIEKLAAIGRIKDQIADLLESAPELNIDDTFDFLSGLVVRELKSRK